MEDPDFNDPVPEPGSQQAQQASNVDPEAVTMLSSMGFSEAQVTAVLEHTKGDAERAADWLFSHSVDLDAAIADLSSNGQPESSGSAPLQAVDDGPGTYQLRGFVSHIGKNTGSGHYIAHVRKFIPALGEERWVIFNDQTVALSEKPPREHAYLYLYERTG